MEIYFKDKQLQKVFTSAENISKKHGTKNSTIACRWITRLKIAKSLSDISNDKPTRLHKLTGGYDEYSIDVDHPFRLIVKVAHEKVPRKPDGGIDLSAVTSIMVVGVEDTHSSSRKPSKMKARTTYPLKFEHDTSVQDIIREYIDLHQYSADDLSQRSGVSLEIVETICSGNATIDQGVAKKLERTTGVAMDIWLGRKSLHPKIVTEPEQMETTEKQTNEAVRQPIFKRMLNWIIEKMAKIFNS